MDAFGPRPNSQLTYTFHIDMVVHKSEPLPTYQ